MLLPEWAKKYIGIPFVELGRDIKGCDCWGLTRLICMNELGFTVPSFTEKYESTYKGENVKDALDTLGVKDKHWDEIEVGKEELGDHVLMYGIYEIEGKKIRAPMHVGLVLIPGTMIHIEENIDSVLCPYREDRHMKRRVIGFYRFRGAK